ncbi:MAG: hypothetical protein UV61_C0016G0019 [Candidatus Gottesmanbacteria bacterium GW2011_GWB1_43_11]|uniref:Uncharacterized protein n=1 Tax=Candidatus Gottesmanbacteria bacterium GW2011_GWB1_43_11 TaxID=1618446 RepID=A0A0G1CJJ7_9BACT|nr:MAG: hypothetical protein UV04_C0006G0033 [Candidatus Gottesmanbacteria bacterium GW2011_GWA2_42_16]KKS52978.1 MAG: hypothetical protein UV17_C0042G0002 [Candidatus Gottesmanbacteria bacterium GW2011_GWA1_42_26]KKS80829.1 MAG: hypothetical protein UV55_C0028G0002 [Candidatus Gottesmanbacteria bacterium GW2011_GWC1_43_10]KKS85647.1 MAG: hypothetical protein UV61_C0016G0019 [Candidatus Gottesmanbacteria bacterium GW2011_GWB1_43_11]OGG10638.1 MAG: hypothetical protein A2699_00225 [Candidatus Go
MLKYAWILSLVLLGLFKTSALATTYNFDAGNNNTITSPQVITASNDQQYIYGVLSSGEGISDYYTLDFKTHAPQLVISLLVSQDRGRQDFQPNFIFGDPNLRERGGSFPYGFPAGVGGRVFDWSGQVTGATFQDGLTGEKFRVGPQIVRDMSAQKYLLVVFDPKSVGGRYVIKIGSATPAEPLLTQLKHIWDWLRVKLDLY